MIRHDRSGKAAPGAGVRRFQYLGPRGHHDTGPVGPSCRGLRSLRPLPGAVLTLRPQISPLPGPAHGPCRISGVCRAIAGARTFRCAAADARAGFSVCADAARDWRAVSVLRCLHSRAIAPRTARPDFSRLFDQWKQPQPLTRIVKSARAVRDAIGFPSVIKTSIGTASRGIWFVRNADDLDMALRDLEAGDAFTARCWCRTSSPALPRRRSRCFAEGS